MFHVIIMNLSCYLRFKEKECLGINSLSKSTLNKGDVVFVNGKCNGHRITGQLAVIKFIPKSPTATGQFLTEKSGKKETDNDKNTNIDGIKMNESTIIGEKLFENTMTGNISIHSAWSKSYSSGVKLVSPFYLYPKFYSHSCQRINNENDNDDSCVSS